MQRYRAERRGQLPANGTVGALQLPAGGPLTPSADFAQTPSARPVAWASDEAVPGVGNLWLQLAMQFPESGLWPMVLGSLDGEDDRPWHAGELDPGLSSAADSHDAASFLASRWEYCVPSEGEDTATIAPFGRTFPGLAPATTGTSHWIVDVVRELEGRLGLVATMRPADVPAHLGWTGPLNHEADMGKFAAVLRSWEDRFGACLVGLGFDTMTLAVQRPPTDAAQAVAIAAEHFAFCPDNIWQGSGSLKSYAEDLVDARAWTLWWD